MAVIATGFFDGVHLGHRLVINTLLSAAQERGEQSMIVTFWPHPRMVLQNDARSLRLLSSLQEKREMLLALGVDRVEVLDFSKEFSRLTASQYLHDVLMERFGGSAIVLGYDNRMGSDGLSHDEIVPLAESMGLDVVTVPAVPMVSSEKLSEPSPTSSTRIRTALDAGDIASANSMLGYRYGLHGVVIAGNQLGRTIGFPTANMQLYEPLRLVPHNGVYLVEVETLGRKFYGMTNIGVRPTVSGAGVRTIETNIFDFDELIYGLDIRIEFIAKIRDERRFDSIDKLAVQLTADRESCLDIIRSLGAR